MIVNTKKCSFGVTDLLMISASVLFAAGIRLWFPVCAAMPESMTVMSCHWAGETLKAVSLLLAALSAAHVFVPDAKVKAGMDIALAGLSVLTALIPGHVIGICAGAEMACRSHTLPWTLVFGAAILLLSLVDLFFYLTRASSQKHRRNA